MNIIKISPSFKIAGNMLCPIEKYISFNAGKRNFKGLNLKILFQTIILWKNVALHKTFYVSIILKLVIAW